MILRLVKMTFKEEETPNFLSFFETVKDDIERMPGILSLKLYQDENDPNVIFTHSIWLSVKFLEEYKKSELFGKVWPKTKLLFAENPLAWSLKLK